MTATFRRSCMKLRRSGTGNLISPLRLRCVCFSGFFTCGVLVRIAMKTALLAVAMMVALLPTRGFSDDCPWTAHLSCAEGPSASGGKTPSAPKSSVKVPGVCSPAIKQAILRAQKDCKTECDLPARYYDGPTNPQTPEEWARWRATTGRLVQTVDCTNSCLTIAYARNTARLGPAYARCVKILAAEVEDAQLRNAR